MPAWTLFGLLKGKATTAWPGRDAAGSEEYSGQDGLLGMPRFAPQHCGDGCRMCADACPTDAISVKNDSKGAERLSVDYGRCVVCQLCIEACPKGVARASSDWAFGARNRNDLQFLVGPGGVAGGEKKPTEPRDGFRRSLHIRHVDAGSCNGCESELQALNNPFYNLHRFGVFFTPSPRFADLLLVTGSVTYAMREPLLRTYEAMAEPRWVMACGACAVCGGIAEGGYACGHGLEGVLPVDLYLPGCPPNPAAIIEAVLMFLDRTRQRVKGGRLVE
ncbi:NADH-quinone oxidoreductase subunit NuoB [Varunaivibrio sulfuroxidans]|uniref:Ni,Fe-hydrogenase III small subunit n=1 Tax=Varunaivibrio sulfuroxidans TaxID=1773489 RepID=A0A4R3JEI6_9PROT|nr:NADH-quinone oxidoreductase subunit NuoB [Varunaivibrio sulfuroxidans]TCS63080.1 Ni,Fe-hydrogenase III small subunit [Varunaivibrio sulfuroxidans]WES31848.1 NADH-quinone oxidoreductase subunit NuoB [Varunaivibrio sulfuroxidans]